MKVATTSLVATTGALTLLFCFSAAFYPVLVGRLLCVILSDGAGWPIFVRIAGYRLNSKIKR